ncbi:MAG: 50S ribosomal protein L13 [Candidatus Micrarchaeota archaeon]|nr:50S ribosomal protein L13 [Candidatus Micrarchaeota archaeon]
MNANQKQARPSAPKKVLYDANDKVLGRLGSEVAKKLLNGDEVAIINAQGAIITGDKRIIIKRYRTRLNLQEKENPEHSPFWPRRSDLLVKRVIRGMLPYRKPSGKSAYRRLRVYMGVPEAFKATKPIEIISKNPKTIYSGYIKVGQLSKLLGYNRE